MTEEALVLDIDSGYAVLRRKEAACATCTSDLCAPKDRTTRAVVPPGLDVRVNDWVELSYSAGGAVVDGLVLLGIPLLGFFAGYVLAPGLFGAPSGSGFFDGDVGRALAGLLGAAVGAIAPILRKRANPDGGLPRVSRVVRRRRSGTQTPRQTAELPGA